MTPFTLRLLSLFWPLLALGFFGLGLFTVSAGLRNSWAPPPLVNPTATPSEPANPA